MPTIKVGDRIRLKPDARPETQHLNPTTLNPGVKLFDDETIFEVNGIKGSKVNITPLTGGAAFTWFKHAIKEVLPPDPTIEDITEEEESVARECGALPKQFRPSNSDQGYAFTSQWCDRCEREAKEGSCIILTESLCDGAKEWIYSEKGEPICTAWTERVSANVDYNGEPKATASVEPPSIVITEQVQESNLLLFQPKNRDSTKPFLTARVTYKNREYWIEGTPPIGKNDIGKYFYCFDCDGSTIASDEPYASPISANTEARKAIDNLEALLEDVAF